MFKVMKLFSGDWSFCNTNFIFHIFFKKISFKTFCLTILDTFTSNVSHEYFFLRYLSCVGFLFLLLNTKYFLNSFLNYLFIPHMVFSNCKMSCLSVS